MKLISLRTVYAALVSLALAGCGGGGGGDGGSGGGSGGGGGGATSFTLTVTLTGLNASGLILANNSVTPVLPVAVAAGTTSVLISSNLANGAAYNIVSQGAPPGVACTPVTAGTNAGTIAGANVTVAYSCAPTFPLGGAISGLTAAGLQIRLFPDFPNAANIAVFNVAPARNATSYQIPAPVRGDVTYVVRIVGQPTGLTCRFANNTTESTAPMNNAAVQVPITCTPGSGPSIYTVGGTVTGHTGNVVVRLNGNSATDQTIGSGGSAFTFGTPLLASGIGYAVTVVTSPNGQVCSAQNGTGTVGTANVTNVAVNCISISSGFTIGGTISGNSGPVVLQLNSANSMTVGGPGFTFAAPLANLASYSVTVATSPAGQACVMGNPIGTVNGANVSNVTVTCSNTATTFTIGGTVTGNSGNVVMRLNNVSANDQTVAAGGGTFTFPGLATGSAYSVAVFSAPPGQVCSPVNVSGTVASANVTNIGVTCANTGSIGGTVTGLTGTGLTLQLNGANDLVVPAASPTFTFPAGQQTGISYGVRIKTQPSGQTCTIIRAVGNIAAGSPTIITSNPLAPAIACTNNVTSPLSGTYEIQALPLRVFLSFYPDGTYILAIHSDDPTCNANNGNGLEYGAYNWNSTTRAFAQLTAAIDTNGGCGLADGAAMTSGTLVKNIDGTLSVDFLDNSGNGDHFLATLAPVQSIANSLIGSWGDNQGFIAYAANGTFFSAQTKAIAQANIFFPGIEDGCYAVTGTTTTGSYTVNLTGTCNVSATQVAVDTTGAIGLSGIGSSALNFTVTGDLLQSAITPNAPSGAGVTRIVTN